MAAIISSSSDFTSLPKSFDVSAGAKRKISHLHQGASPGAVNTQPPTADSRPEPMPARKKQRPVKHQVQTDLVHLLLNLGAASEEADRLLQGQRAEELRNNWQTKQFAQDLRVNLRAHSRPVFEAAITSREKLLRLPIDTFEAWKPIVKAGILLSTLDRPKRIGDGKRAYHILWEVVWEICNVFVDFTGCIDDASNLAFSPVLASSFIFADIYKTSNDMLAAIDKAYDECTLTEEEEEAIDEEKNRAFDEFVQMTSEPLAKAIRLCREEQKNTKSKTLAKQAAEFEEDLGKLACMASQTYGHDFLGLGFELWSDARRELTTWSRTMKGDNKG